MIDIKTALREAIDQLKPTSTSAELDAAVLLAHVLKKSTTFLYTHSEKTLEFTQLKLYQSHIAQRSEGVPIAYLTKRREFWSLPLQVSEATLIPRPETELLVELVLRELHHLSPAHILDLGTGSGAIALAVGSERPDWQILAIDSSKAAIAVTKANAKQLGLSNVSTLHSDWFTALKTQRFHAIISNPPYIADNDPHLKQGDLRFEPLQALASGPDGLDALTYIIKHSRDYLLPDGLLLLEHGFQQKEAVQTLLLKQGYQSIHTWQDTQGHDRVSTGCLKK